jgi:hypothetical protein
MRHRGLSLHGPVSIYGSMTPPRQRPKRQWREDIEWPLWAMLTVWASAFLVGAIVWVLVAEYAPGWGDEEYAPGKTPRNWVSATVGGAVGGGAAIFACLRKLNREAEHREARERNQRSGRWRLRRERFED